VVGTAGLVAAASIKHGSAQSAWAAQVSSGRTISLIDLSGARSQRGGNQVQFMETIRTYGGRADIPPAILRNCWFRGAAAGTS
jgi:hypothetical protein